MPPFQKEREMFSFKVRGLNTIDEDFQTVKKDIDKKIFQGLKELSGDMVDWLDEQIQWFYDEYEPTTYERRGLMASDAFKTVSVNARSVGLEYLPSGHYPGVPEWSHYQYPPSDKMIAWAAEGEADKGIPPRPFWNDFIDDVANRAMGVIADNLTGYTVTSDGNDFLLDGTEKCPRNGADFENDGITDDYAIYDEM